MEIIDRQNESDSLMIQATARLLYNRADTIDNCYYSSFA